jgi:2-polyprenyl-3-methyl-5-hydroxy-6-metoxy-1,4-benzoquinol methylase
MENLKSNPQQSFNSKRKRNSFFSSQILLNKNLLVGDVLDFGCGFGNDVKLLKKKE